MKLLALVLVFIIPSSILIAQDTIGTRIVLIGDAGELSIDKRHKVVEAVRKTVKLDAKTVILFLGDNVYPNGLADSDYYQYPDYKAILDSQIAINRGTKATVYMIPGNHDWQNGSR